MTIALRDTINEYFRYLFAKPAIAKQFAQLDNTFIFYIYAAMGSTLFEKINPVLWGDVSISMLTLFRVMTFEDWTDVMHETMTFHPLSWTYYMSFIFFTAFAFLNMLIGIIVNVMDGENQKVRSEEALEANEPTIKDIYLKLEALEARLEYTSEKSQRRE